MNSQDILYHQAIEKEKIERLSFDCKDDYELADKLRKELFDNLGISLNLIKQQFYRKGNKECSNFIEKWYFDLKKNDMLTPVVENTIDNALSKIQDKSKLPFYLELIKENNKFSLVMVMLGRWKIKEEKSDSQVRI